VENPLRDHNVDAMRMRQLSGEMDNVTFFFLFFYVAKHIVVPPPYVKISISAADTQATWTQLLEIKNPEIRD